MSYRAPGRRNDVLRRDDRRPGPARRDRALRRGDGRDARGDPDGGGASWPRTCSRRSTAAATCTRRGWRTASCAPRRGSPRPTAPSPRAAGSASRRRPEHGGMGLPMDASPPAVNEMMAAACLSLQLNPLLTQGQIEALEHHATDELKALYLPKLISGEWTGTMNLTEPQAGSDVGALRPGPSRTGDGTYAITGQKIYISWGDHDLAENVCHLVLARLPDGAPGHQGDQPVPGAEVPARRGRAPRRGQRAAAGRPRAQDGPAWLAHLRDGVRRRDRLAGRPAAWRHGGDVHDDEQRPARRRRPGPRRRRGGDAEGARLSRSTAGRAGRRTARRRSPSTPTCAGC